MYKDGFVYTLGGCSLGGKPTNICERYNIRANSWEAIEFMHEARIRPSAQTDNRNNIYVFGGFGNKGQPLLTIEKYSISEDRWYMLGP